MAAPAAGGAGGPAGAPAMGAGSWIGNTMSSLWGQVKIYTGMAHARITAPRRRNTLDEILAYTERAEYIPPLWLTELAESGKIDKKLIDTAIVAGKRAHGAAFSVLRSYMIYLDAHTASLKGANASLRTDLRAATEQLLENILLYNVYTYFKYLNRINLRKIASSRGSGVSIKALATESQNVAIEASIWGESRVAFDAMPYELCQRLNAIVAMNPILAANYLLEASPEAGVHTKPPKIIGLPDVDESTEEELGAAMENAIIRAEDILSAIEKLWNDAANMEPSSEDFSKALVSLVKANKTTSVGASMISSAFDSIVGAGAIAGAMGDAGENYNSLASASGGGGVAAAIPVPAFTMAAPGSGRASASVPAITKEKAMMRRFLTPKQKGSTRQQEAALAAAAANAIRRANAAAGSSSGGQGGGARRSRKARRHTHKHRSHKAKIHHRSRISRRRRQQH